MNINDITNSFLIIFIFCVINIITVFAIGIDKIKKDWGKYKCLPYVMPFSKTLSPDGTSASETFKECTDSILKNTMTTIFAPMYKLLDSITEISDKLSSYMELFANLGNYFQNNFLSAFSNVSDMVRKFLIGFSGIAITTQDLINKLMGIIYVIINIMMGMNFTINSLWNGLPGEIVRAVT